jgi:hypothetical protein
MSYLTFVIYCVVQLLMAYFGYLDVAMQLYVYYIYIYIYVNGKMMFIEWDISIYQHRMLILWHLIGHKSCGKITKISHIWIFFSNSSLIADKLVERCFRCIMLYRA